MTSEVGGRGFQPPKESGHHQPPAGDEVADQQYGSPVGAHVEPPALSQVAELLAAVPSPLLEAKAALEEHLSLAASAPVKAMSETAFSGIGNVQGVAVGFSDENTAIAAPPGSPCLVLYVAEPSPPDQVQGLVAQALGVSPAAASAAFPARAVVTGIIDAQPHRFRVRQAPAGVSVGHFNITAGTIGCFVTGRSAPRDRRLLMLSNNHVLANVNEAAVGDAIIQPGPADAGSTPADQVALLERFIPINFDGENFVDCATAWCWPERVRTEQVFLSGGAQQQFFQTGAEPVQPMLDMAVAKSGRTTQLTNGRITGISVTANVNYNGRVANFRDQIAITGMNGTFSAGGDSGSLIFTRDTNRQPVGLLFAGGGGTTFANRIDRVLAALDITLTA